MSVMFISYSLIPPNPHISISRKRGNTSEKTAGVCSKISHPDLCCLCLCSTHLFNSSLTILSFYLQVYTSTNLTPVNSKSMKTKEQLSLLKPKENIFLSQILIWTLPSPDCPARVRPIVIHAGTSLF